MMKKNIFTVILCMGVGISAVTMTGCGKNLTQIAQQQEDDCVVVKLPEGYGARDLFDIVSSTETFITYASEGFGSGKSIYTGELASMTQLSLAISFLPLASLKYLPQAEQV